MKFLALCLLLSACEIKFGIPKRGTVKEDPEPVEESYCGVCSAEFEGDPYVFQRLINIECPGFVTDDDLCNFNGCLMFCLPTEEACDSVSRCDETF